MLFETYFSPQTATQLAKFFIGSDLLSSDFKNLEELSITNSKYPPYNVIREDENNYILEMAVAGFSPEDISVSTKNGYLTISAKKNSITTEKSGKNEIVREYVHRGLASREFTQTMKLHSDMFVTGARYENGILTVNMEHRLPEHLKEQKFLVNSA